MERSDPRYAAEIFEPAIPEEALAALATLYGEVAQAVADMQHACKACGQCCRFAEMGHTLFASQLEVAYHVRHHGARAVADMDICPWQEGAACAAREGRPLGCRVFFCDASGPDAERQERVSAEAHMRLKVLHETHGIPYRYGPFLRQIDALAREAGVGGA